MESFSNLLRHVIRRLMRSPLFTIVTLITIGIGVGANTAIFSVVNGIVLKPLPYADPARLVSVWQTAPGINIKDLNASPSDYFTFKEENHTFQQFGLYNSDSVSITGLAAPERAQSFEVTEGTLNAFGVQPALGRWFTTQDDTPGTPETAILSYGYWQRKFGGDPAAIGREIRVDGSPKTIIGVMPQSFRFLDEQPDLILPLRFERGKTFLGNFSYRAIARLKSGVTLAQANADVARMIPIVNTKFAPPSGFSVKLFDDARIQPSVRPLKQDVVGDLGKVLWVLMGSIGVVLLIACANVANLLLVRAEGRQQEFAVRVALGAGSKQIARELLTESVLLGLLGGLAGLGLAYGALRLLVSIGPGHLPRLENVTIDLQALLFTLALSLLAGVLFGLIPVFRYARAGVATALRAGGRTISQSKETHRTRNALVVLQTALAVVLLIGSGLMIRTFQALRRVNPGFTKAEELQTLAIFIPDVQVKEPERVLRMQQEIQRRLSEIPGVASAAFANSVPDDGSSSADVLYPEDRHYKEGQLPPIRRYKFVAPGFFETMGTPMVAGRDLTWADLYDKRNVVMVSENFARELWRTPSAALGKRIREGMDDPWREIVGVVADVHSDGPDQPAAATIYWPVMMKTFWGNAQFMQRYVVYAIRSNRAGTESFLGQIKKAVWAVDPDLPLAHVRTQQELYRKSMERSSFTLVMLAIAGGMAFLLGIVGIYGVISYSVTQRSREMGIRIALGAQRNALQAMIVRDGVLLGAIGLALGLAAAAALTQIMTSFLFDVSRLDVLTYCAVSAGLLLSAGLASYLPARRASGMDPVIALRAE
ncbi:MAG: ABC transporter permease [Bryobacteraceae bacterium]|jgi:predicted permease